MLENSGKTGLQKYHIVGGAFFRVVLCKECNKKSGCIELCEDAEKYVSQDHVSAKHNNFTFPDMDRFRLLENGNSIELYEQYYDLKDE